MSRKRRVGIVVACAVALVVVMAVGAWFWLKSSLQSEVHRTLERIERDSKGAVKVKAGSLSVEPILRRATLRDVTIDLRSPQGTPVTLHVDALEVKKWKQLGDGTNLLREQALEWHSVTSPQLDAQLAQASKLVKKVLGEALVLDVSHNVSYRPERENAFELDVTASCAKLGALVLHLAASGVDLKQLNQIARDQQARSGPAALDAEMRNRTIAAFAGAKLHGVRLAVRNAGVFETIVAAEASQAGITGDEERRKMRDQLRLKCGASPNEPWTKRVCPALTAFVENPKSLSLTLAPTAPFALSSIPVVALSAGPSAVMDQLGLSLVANQ